VMLLSPSMLTFGSQNLLSTSAAQSITLSNTGAGTLSIASIAPSGDYARTTTCGSTLAAGANCSINVTFTPTATGTRAGTITISSDASGSPHSAVLSGVALASGSVNMSSGWNLIGNGHETSLDVPTVFADSTKITTVWKWVITGSTAGIAYPAWAFYTPALPDGGQAYAASKGYDYLSTINAGEGFWVNAQTAFAVAMPTGTAVQSTSFMPALPSLGMPGGTHALGHSWSLIATGDNPTPTQFDAAISTFEAVPPAAGSSNVYTNLTTLWAWDAAKTSWYFWAPALVNNGGLAAYLTSKGYLDFASMPSGKMSQSTGFWVNVP
jgi:hypothetical protein